MGDRYYMSLNCKNCKHLDDDVYYAPSSGYFDFKCSECGSINWINHGFSNEVISEEERDKRLKENGFGI